MSHRLVSGLEKPAFAGFSVQTIPKETKKNCKSKCLLESCRCVFASGNVYVNNAAGVSPTNTYL